MHYSLTVVETTGRLRQGTNYIDNISDTSDIRVGDLVLSHTKVLSDFTYVKEVIDTGSVFLTKEIPVSVNNETLYFIDHRGLKGYTQDYSVINGDIRAFRINDYKGDLYKPKDVIIHSDLGNSVYNTVTLLSSDGSMIIQESFSSLTPTNNQPLLFYYHSGIKNISLSGYCVGNIFSTRTILNASLGANTLSIDADNIYNYQGDRVDIRSLSSDDIALSAYGIKYDDISIPIDTYITAVSPDDNTITLSNPITEIIRADSVLSISLSTPYNSTNLFKDECFAPGGSPSPFKTTDIGLTTPAMSGIDIGSNTVAFNSLILNNINTQANVQQAPLNGQVNALIPIRDINNTSLFLIASTSP
jgi:hypothetical protein